MKGNEKSFYFFLFKKNMNNSQGDTNKDNESSQSKITPNQSGGVNKPSDIQLSEKTLSDEVFLQYLHDSPPIDELFVFYSIFWIILLI